MRRTCSSGRLPHRCVCPSGPKLSSAAAFQAHWGPLETASAHCKSTCVPTTSSPSELLRALQHPASPACVFPCLALECGGLQWIEVDYCAVGCWFFVLFFPLSPFLGACVPPLLPFSYSNSTLRIFFVVCFSWVFHWLYKETTVHTNTYTSCGANENIVYILKLSQMG